MIFFAGVNVILKLRWTIWLNETNTSDWQELLQQTAPIVNLNQVLTADPSFSPPPGKNILP